MNQIAEKKEREKKRILRLILLIFHRINNVRICNYNLNLNQQLKTMTETILSIHVFIVIINSRTPDKTLDNVLKTREK